MVADAVVGLDVAAAVQQFEADIQDNVPAVNANAAAPAAAAAAPAAQGGQIVASRAGADAHAAFIGQQLAQLQANSASTRAVTGTGDLDRRLLQPRMRKPIAGL